MATNSVTVSPTYNGDSVSLTAGMIVRLKPGANNNVVRAQADSAPHAQGVNGVVISGASAPATGCVVVCTGKETVQMESGLTLAVGQTVYVSPNVAGKGTNILPAVVVPIGTICDVSAYASGGTVEVDVVVNAGSSAGGGGAFPGYGTAPPVVAASLSVPGTALTVARSDHDHGQVMVAQWPLTNPRIYAVDGTNGNDSNVGFVDAASSSAGDVQTATVAAGLVAKKTFTGLAAVFPLQGANRTVAIVVASGTYADSLGEAINGCQGYILLVVRGTGTNATAGCTAFDGSANDLLYVGATTATGMNAGGYNPTGGATTTSVPCQLNGGGAVTFPAEPAIPLGCRIRFAANTTTVALQNQTAAIVGASGSTLTLSHVTRLSQAPATGDVFFIEMPGVLTPASPNSVSITGSAEFGTISNYLIGINMTGGAFSPLGSMFLGFFFASGGLGCGTGEPIAIDSTGHLGGIYVYVDGASFPRVGGAGRIDGFINFDFAACAISLPAFVFHCTAPPLSAADVQAFYVGDGAVFSPNLSFGGNHQAISFSGTTLGALTNLSEQKTRVLGNGSRPGLTLSTFYGVLGGIDVSGVGAHPAVSVAGTCFIRFGLAFTGSTGNTDVGMDLTNAFGCTIVLNSVPTVTGTAGDVRLSDGTIISWATAAAGVIDTNGNQIYAPQAAPLGTKVASAATTVALGNVAPASVTSATPTAWTPLVINGVKYMIPLWPST